MYFDLKATESSSMKQSLVISDKKWKSFGVISDSICPAAAVVGHPGVAHATKGHQLPTWAGADRRVTRRASLDFLSALWRRAAPKVAGLSSPGCGTELRGRNVFPNPWLSWMRYDAQDIMVPEGLRKLLMNCAPKFKEGFLRIGLKKTNLLSLIWHLCAKLLAPNDLWALDDL